MASAVSQCPQSLQAVVSETLDGLKSADDLIFRFFLTSKNSRQAAVLERSARGDDVPSASAKPSCANHSERAARCAQGDRDVSRAYEPSPKSREKTRRRSAPPSDAQQGHGEMSKVPSDKFRPARSRSPPSAPRGRGGDEQVFVRPSASPLRQGHCNKEQGNGRDRDREADRTR